MPGELTMTLLQRQRVIKDDLIITWMAGKWPAKPGVEIWNIEAETTGGVVVLPPFDMRAKKGQFIIHLTFNITLCHFFIHSWFNIITI
jgi:hypothetical protein